MIESPSKVSVERCASRGLSVLMNWTVLGGGRSCLIIENHGVGVEKVGHFETLEASAGMHHDRVSTVDTNSKPFWVVICSVCGKRVNVETSSIYDRGGAVHSGCYASESALASQKSPTQPVPIKPLNRWRTFATRMVKEAICVLAEGHN